MKKNHFLILFFTVFIISNSLKAQTVQDKSTKIEKPTLDISHSVYGSIGFIYVGLGYDVRFRLPNKIDMATSIGYGAGTFPWGGFEIDASFTNVPFAVTVLCNKGKHSFETGLTVEYKNQKMRPLETDTFTVFTNKYVAYMPTIGYRYQANGFSPLVKVQGALGAGVSRQTADRPYVRTSNNQIIIDGFLRASVGFSF